MLENNDFLCKLQVCYVDYGNVEWVHERHIRCIKEEFMSLPFQASHGRLADVHVVDKYKMQPKVAM